VKRFAGAAKEFLSAERPLGDMPLVLLGDRRERDDVPSFPLEDMADEVVLVQALHDDDDHAAGLVVEAGIERAVKPFVAGKAATFRHRIGGLEWIVDQNEIGATAGEHAPDRSRHSKPALRGDQFLQRRAGGGEPGRERPLIPWRRHDGAAVARELVGEFLAVGHIDDGQSRVVAEKPGRQRDRGGARRDVDDEPSDATVAYPLKLGGHHFDVPARQE